ncbi:TPA: hypothetical protein L4559_005190 [Pseudomonas aeruginosa]|nr:hypothetical protein [Pseudomonas aeruginosa]
MTDVAITPRKQRIIEIADELVCGMVAKGTLDPEDESALDSACRQAVKDATALYDAAIEYVS